MGEPRSRVEWLEVQSVQTHSLDSQNRRQFRVIVPYALLSKQAEKVLEQKATQSSIGLQEQMLKVEVS